MSLLVEAVGSAIASALQRAQQHVTVLARDQKNVDVLSLGRCEKLPKCDPVTPLQQLRITTVLPQRNNLCCHSYMEIKIVLLKLLKNKKLLNLRLLCFVQRVVVTIMAMLCCLPN